MSAHVSRGLASSIKTCCDGLGAQSDPPVTHEAQIQTSEDDTVACLAPPVCPSPTWFNTCGAHRSTYGWCDLDVKQQPASITQHDQVPLGTLCQNCSPLTPTRHQGPLLLLLLLLPLLMLPLLMRAAHATLLRTALPLPLPRYLYPPNCHDSSLSGRPSTDQSNDW